MDTKNEVLFILDEALHLNGRTAAFSDRTVLLGEIPELDSMAVVSVIAGLEEHFGFTVDDDEIDGATFATLGSLIRFVAEKIERS